MTTKRVTYKEGDWFLVPVADGRWSPGVLARVGSGGILFGYFFRPETRSDAEAVIRSRPHSDEAYLVARFGHLGLKKGIWQVVMADPAWDRSDWPSPTFGREISGTGKGVLVEYRDDNPSLERVQKIVPVAEIADFPQDGLAGAQYIELVLAKFDRE